MGNPKRSFKHKKSQLAKRRKARQAAGSGPHFTPPPLSPVLQEGLSYLGKGKLAEAEFCLTQAARTEPDNPIARNCLGIVLRLLGRHDDAMRELNTVITDNPRFPEAHNNLGNVLRDLNRLDEARECYERALEINPKMAEAHNNLGVIHLSSHDASSAIRSFELALLNRPQYFEAFNNLGNAFRDVGNLEAARDNYQKAIQLQPRSAEVYNNLANAFRDLGDRDAAKKNYLHALELQPSFAEASENLGVILADDGELDAAVSALDRSIEVRPDSVDTLVQLGDVHKERGRLDEALEVYHRAGSLEPHNRIHELRTTSLCPTVFESHRAMHRYRLSIEQLWHELSSGDLASGESLLSTRLVEPPFALQFLDGNLRELKMAYAGIFEDRLPERSPSKTTGKPKIGFVVTRTHEGIFVKSMRGVLHQLDPQLADLVIVCPQASIAEIRPRLGRDVEYVPLSHSFVEMEKQIRAECFDVLYYWEIGTDVTNYFLPFLRLAQVQCTSWGVQVTSGIKNVDFYISNDLVEPTDAAEHYSEELIRARTPLCYQYCDTATYEPNLPASLNISPDSHVYLCVQQLGKYHPDFDSTMAQILRRDSKGVVVGIADRHGVEAERLRQRLRQSIPDVQDRIHFLPRQERRGYAELVRAADVLLDTPHFVGVNTSYDAFTFNKPLVTCPSNFHRGRYTLGCYRKMGIGECVAEDQQEYVDLAIELAENTDRRERLEADLAAASPCLFEDLEAVREHERIFSDLIDLARQRSKQGL